MAKENWEEWLNAEGDDVSSRSRFRSLYFDMLEVCRAEFGRVVNMYALAAYIVWLNLPKRVRVPATQIELAHILEFNDDDIFRKWRKRYPTLFTDDRTRSIALRMVIDSVPDVIDATLDSAINGGVQGFQDRKLVLDMAGMHKNQTVVTGDDAGGPVQLVVEYVNKRGEPSKD